MNRRTFRLIWAILPALAAAGCLSAQAPNTVSYAPSYFVGAGAEYNRYNTAGPSIAGWTTFAVDRASRRWSVAQARRQVDAASEAYDGLYEA